MKTLEEMKLAGIDTEQAMERFMNNEDMYRKFLHKLPAETSYKDMMDAIEDQNVEGAFDAAHKLKGIVGNLALVKIYNSLYDIVETLRNGNLPDKEDLSAFSRLYMECIMYIESV